MVDGVIKQYELTRTWDVLNDIISSNITDPAIPKREKSGDWIKNGFPNPGEVNKKSGWVFPLVVIRISDIEAENKALDGTTQLMTHSVSIECSATTRKKAAELSEEINFILTGSTGRSELMKATLHLFGINGTSEDSDFVSGIKYYTKTVDYNFQRFD